MSSDSVESAENPLGQSAGGGGEGGQGDVGSAPPRRAGITWLYRCRDWWQDLSMLFGRRFLVFVSTVCVAVLKSRSTPRLECMTSALLSRCNARYFLQGLGVFPTYLQNYYLMRSYSSSCPCMVDGTCPSVLPQGCHMGLGLEPSEQSAVKAFALLPWSYVSRSLPRHILLYARPGLCG